MQNYKDQKKKSVARLRLLKNFKKYFTGKKNIFTSQNFYKGMKSGKNNKNYLRLKVNYKNSKYNTELYKNKINSFNNIINLNNNNNNNTNSNQMSKDEKLVIFNNFINNNVIKTNSKYFLSIGDRYFISYIIESFFLSLHALIGKPVFIITPSKVKVRVFYFAGYKYHRYLSQSGLGFKLLKAYNVNLFLNFVKKMLIRVKKINHDYTKVTDKDVLAQVNNQFIELFFTPFLLKGIYNNLLNSQLGHRFKLQFQRLAYILSLIFDKEIELECIELHYPHLNSDILAKFLTINSKKKKISSECEKDYSIKQVSDIIMLFYLMLIQDLEKQVYRFEYLV